MLRYSLSIALSAIISLSLVVCLCSKVTKLHDKRAPGCNLVKRQCKNKKVNGKTVRKYFNTMRALILPRPATPYVSAGAPYQEPGAR